MTSFHLCYKVKCLVKFLPTFKIGLFPQYLRIIEFFVKHAGYSSYQTWDLANSFSNVDGNFKRPEFNL